MASDARQLLDEALRLSEPERAELAAKLIESLGEGEAGDTAEAVEAAWAVEIERRCAALDSGETATSAIG